MALCGMSFSCSDDYDLDDTKPSFLGESIYNELQNRGNFTTMIRLIDDLDLTEVMRLTGSNTLFVAPDSAFNTFFRTTNWTKGASGTERVTCYEDLSNAQKRLLLKGAMLSNANVLEMLTTLSNSSEPIKNVCLRQESSLSLTDSIPFMKWNELPVNLNEGTLDDDGNVTNADIHYWDAYRDQSKGGIYLALDNTKTLMTHFLEAQLNEKNITHADVSFILNLDKKPGATPWTDEDTKNRSFIYDAEIIEQDVTCQNGYFNVLDKVLVTPSNMAEMIRTSPKTTLFSSILERFSAPYYDASLTREYKSLYDISQDSVYTKIYFASRGSNGAISTDPSGETLNTLYSSNLLDYDPGWNSYKVNNLTMEQDMAAMFVPNDDAVKKYFLSGAGESLITQYIGDTPNDEEHLQENLYKLPLNIVKPMVTNLMKESFIETVPSKYLTIMNDSKDQMFPTTSPESSSLTAYKANVDTVMLANNGVVYVLKSFPSPATYVSVMAPVLYNKGTQVINAVIHADDSYVNTNYANAPLRKYYSTYLLAMQSNFTLFAPTDEGLLNKGYYDPLNTLDNASGTRHNYWTFEKVNSTISGKVLPILAKRYSTMVKADVFSTSGSPNNQSAAGDNLESSTLGPRKKLMLIDMIDQHIIVHEDDEPNGIDGTKNFYVSRGNAPVYVQSMGSGTNNAGMVVKGGFQLYRANGQEGDDFNNFDCTVTQGFDQSKEGNGHTYFLDRPMQPSLYTVYEMLNENPDYSEFAELCGYFSPDNSEAMELLSEVFRYDADGKNLYTKDKDWLPIRNKYCIYAPNSKTDGARYTRTGSKLVRFFNNYRYSIFVPSNDAMEKAYNEAKLPRFTDILSEVFVLDADGSIVTDDNGKNRVNEYDKDKVQAEIACLINYLRYHFCDESFFVEKAGYSDSGEDAQSACIPSETYQTFNVKHEGGKLYLTDVTGSQITTSDYVNQLARDYELTKGSDNTSLKSNPYNISSSSYVSIHGLDGYMTFDSSLKGDFSKAWETTSKARAFVKKYSPKF